MNVELSQEQLSTEYWYLRDKKKRVINLPQPLTSLADTHAHLTVFQKTDPAEALVRAALAGLRFLVMPLDPTEDVKDVPAFLTWWDEIKEHARAMLEQLEKIGIAISSAKNLFDELYFLAGIHPYGAQIWLDDASAHERLDMLLAHPHCLGIGEIGLDFGPYNELPQEVQLETFHQQLRMAHEYNLPVELHLRDGENDSLGHDLALQLLRKEGVPQAGCDLHCFTSGPEVMKPFVELGCHIAFGGAATFKRSDDIRAAFLACPDELLLSETDCPYMAPTPLRGMECEPAMVALTIDFLAEQRELAGVSSRAETYRNFWCNAHRFFGLTF